MRMSNSVLLRDMRSICACSGRSGHVSTPHNRELLCCVAEDVRVLNVWPPQHHPHGTLLNTGFHGDFKNYCALTAQRHGREHLLVNQLAK